MKSKKKAPINKPTVHYTEQYLIDPQHPVTINVIGCGGTGSQVLNSLARMHHALKALGHAGIYVRAVDPDRVSDANMGRQLFSPSDVGEHKATVLVGRINRFFATDWESLPVLFNSKNKIPQANITISCVDSGAARKDIWNVLYSNCVKPVPDRYGNLPSIEPYHKPYYWMDFGNTQDRGQVLIGSLRKIKQPESKEYNCIEELRCIHMMHPDIFVDKKGDGQGPSCSLAEALQKQDLFINTNLANAGLALLWKMFREARIQHHGLYLNMQTGIQNPIKVK